VAAAFEALDAGMAMIAELNFDNYHPGVRLRALERLETARRQQAVSSHDLIAGLVKEEPADVGGPSRPVYLGSSRRTASPDQRVVLSAKDRGCSAPGCDVPGYWTEVHHVDDWARGGSTDIDKLTLACKPDHNLAEKGWRTIKLANGETQWIPPPHLDHGQARTNDYHHPERYLPDDGEQASA
jgi:hypothetical protein